MDKTEQYLELLKIAIALGGGLVSIIKGYAKRDLSDEEYAALETKWDGLVDRTARNAGLTPG